MYSNRLQDWNAEDHLAFMEKNKISKSILSCTGPGTHLIPGDDALGREVTREVNEFAANLKRRFPTKFGFFASLPLPDIDGTLAEIDYALDELDADGFVLMSNFHGMYLGDARLAPVYAKLQARKAIVFVHPTTPCNAQACNYSDLTPRGKLDRVPLSDSAVMGTLVVGMMGASRLPLNVTLAHCVPRNLVEYFFDSARTFVDLLLAGTAAAHRTSPSSVLDRALLLTSPEKHHFQTRPGAMQELTAPAVKEMFSGQFYFDLAGSPMPNQIHSMLRWVKSDRFLYGSDVPFTSWTAAESLDIYHGNAERLFAGKD
ncbi:hypothetical protein C8R43DRAFT_969355 [Mycena crocata]|nr:hypothetical protein C8R43DRAFT_969355 [Mycena crocata]